MKAEHYVGGVFRADGTSFPLIAPADGSELGAVPEATREVADDAVTAARAALKGPWGALGVQERAAALRTIADGIQARFDEFVDAEVADTGRPREFASTVDVPRAIGNFRAYADLLYGRPERAYMTQVPGWSSGTGEALNYTVRRPLGAVAIISPWNLPLLLSTWKIAPALACGNTVVLKPSEETPSTATLLARVIHDAGLPDGVFNVVHGHGAGAAGEFLTGHPGVDAIAFTGESATGAAIMRNAAEYVTPLSFELGGKNPALVFADADLDAAVDGTVRSTFPTPGRSACAPSASTWSGPSSTSSPRGWPTARRPSTATGR